MLTIKIHDEDVEAAIRERSRMLNTDPEIVLIRAAAESLGLPMTANRYTDILVKGSRQEQVAIPA